jgi:hypothetical protein
MTHFIRLPNKIINLAFVRQIEWDQDQVLLHYAFGQRQVLNGDDAAALLQELEDAFGLMTHSSSRLTVHLDLTDREEWGDEEVSA